MCTQARLVQADKASAWFGMPMANAAPVPANFTLREGTPAFLEVTVDPAAHGPQGIGPIRRGITLKLAGGRELNFEVIGTIVQ